MLIMDKLLKFKITLINALREKNVADNDMLSNGGT